MDQTQFQRHLDQQPGVNWGLERVPERYRIDPSKKYRTRNGKAVVCIEVVLYNSVGHEVTNPVKGTIVLREKPWKTAFGIWTLDGRWNVASPDSGWDLVPSDD